MKTLILACSLILTMNCFADPIDSDLQAVMLHPKFAAISKSINQAATLLGNKVPKMSEPSRESLSGQDYFYLIPVNAVEVSEEQSKPVFLGTIVAHLEEGDLPLPNVTKLNFLKALTGSFALEGSILMCSTKHVIDNGHEVFIDLSKEGPTTSMVKISEQKIFRTPGKDIEMNYLEEDGKRVYTSRGITLSINLASYHDNGVKSGALKGDLFGKEINEELYCIIK